MFRKSFGPNHCNRLPNFSLSPRASRSEPTTWLFPALTGGAGPALLISCFWRLSQIISRANSLAMEKFSVFQFILWLLKYSSPRNINLGYQSGDLILAKVDWRGLESSLLRGASLAGWLVDRLKIGQVHESSPENAKLSLELTFANKGLNLPEVFWECYVDTLDCIAN